VGGGGGGGGGEGGGGVGEWDMGDEKIPATSCAGKVTVHTVTSLLAKSIKKFLHLTSIYLKHSEHEQKRIAEHISSKQKVDGFGVWWNM
jgi:hypothetical protein